MIEAYNYYLGGYLPKVSPKTNVHDKRELKSKYKCIVSLNSANPLVMLKMSDATQAYALDVKEMSMELGEAASEVLEGRSEDTKDNLQHMTGLFNRLLHRSDEYGQENGKPSRPGGELRNLVEKYAGELIESGVSIADDGSLSVESELLSVPEEFATSLQEKCEKMSMNPLEYVEKKVYSYGHLAQRNISSAYEPSMYSGMLFNSYC